MDPQYGLEEEEEVQSQDRQSHPVPISSSQPDVQQPDTELEPDEVRVLSEWENDNEADPRQIGHGRVLKRIKFNESQYRGAF